MKPRKEKIHKKEAVKKIDAMKPKKYECASIPCNYETGGGKR